VLTVPGGNARLTSYKARATGSGVEVSRARGLVRGSAEELDQAHL
jgi:hypothetical protein